MYNRPRPKSTKMPHILHSKRLHEQKLNVPLYKPITTSQDVHSPIRYVSMQASPFSNTLPGYPITVPRRASGQLSQLSVASLDRQLGYLLVSRSLLVSRRLIGRWLSVSRRLRVGLG